MSVCVWPGVGVGWWMDWGYKSEYIKHVNTQTQESAKSERSQLSEMLIRTEKAPLLSYFVWFCLNKSPSPKTFSVSFEESMS